MNAMSSFLAVVTLAAAVAAMSLRNPVHCALCLVMAFGGLAGIYLRLGAEFLGLAQVLVYIGAVAILLVFVLLLTRSGHVEPRTAGGTGWRMGLLICIVTAGVLVAVVMSTAAWPARSGPAEARTVRQVGEALMTDFVVPLQIVGVLLTGALIGAALLARDEARPVPRKEGALRE